MRRRISARNHYQARNNSWADFGAQRNCRRVAVCILIAPAAKFAQGASASQERADSRSASKVERKQASPESRLFLPALGRKFLIYITERIIWNAPRCILIAAKMYQTREERVARNKRKMGAYEGNEEGLHS